MPASYPFALLLTATVRPRVGLPDRVVASTELRRATYAGNLRKWLTAGLPIEHVVVAENSGVSLDFLNDAMADLPGAERVELLTCVDEFDGRLGKGYGEARLIESALTTSRWLPHARRIFKVTGLQTVANLGRLNSRIDPAARWVVDIREHRFYQALGRAGSPERGCDTRCFFTEPGFYVSQIAGCWQDAAADREFYLEHAFYRAAKRLAGIDGVRLRFPIEPRYRGVAGHWHKDYDSPAQLGKWLARSVVRTLLPNLYV